MPNSATSWPLPCNTANNMAKLLPGGKHLPLAGPSVACRVQRPLSRRSQTAFFFSLSAFFLGWSAAPLDPFYLAAQRLWCLRSSICCGSLLSVTISSAALCYVSRSTGQSIILQCKKFVYHCRTTHIKCATDEEKKKK